MLCYQTPTDRRKTTTATIVKSDRQDESRQGDRQC